MSIFSTAASRWRRHDAPPDARAPAARSDGPQALPATIIVVLTETAQRSRQIETRGIVLSSVACLARCNGAAVKLRRPVPAAALSSSEDVCRLSSVLPQLRLTRLVGSTAHL